MVTHYVPQYKREVEGDSRNLLFTSFPDVRSQFAGYSAKILLSIVFLVWFRFVFLIPAESGEKITLGISTMLNMTVFLMTVMSGLPPTDETPILSELTLTHCFQSLICSSILKNLSAFALLDSNRTRKTKHG